MRERAADAAARPHSRRRHALLPPPFPMATPRRSARLASPAPAAMSRAPRGAKPQSGADHATFEFCGPLLGPVGMLIGLPGVCYALVAACNDTGCVAGADLFRPAAWPGLGGRALFSWAGLAAVVAWFVAQAAVHLVAPGRVAEGVVLSTGTRLPYKLTGVERGGGVVGMGARPRRPTRRPFPPGPTNLAATLVATALLFFSKTAAGAPRLAWAYDHFVELLTGAVAGSFLLSVTLYLASFRRARPAVLLAPHGATGWRLYDFFMGRELNPRAGGGWGLKKRRGVFGAVGKSLARFDWKEFCELYPGLLGWVVLDAACAAKQLERVRGEEGGKGGRQDVRRGRRPLSHPPQTGSVSPAMLLVLAFHAVYVADALLHEGAILTTMDITTDGFGFMLAFGDLAWVPFVYCAQARYLADHPNVRGGGGGVCGVVGGPPTRRPSLCLSAPAPGRHRRHPRAQPGWLHHLPRVQLPKGRVPPRPPRPRGRRPPVHPDRGRPPPARRRLVGPRPPHQLLWRLVAGPLVVRAVRGGVAGAPLLRFLFCGAPPPPRPPRRRVVRCQVWGRLGPVLRPGAVAHRAVRLLIEKERGGGEIKRGSRRRARSCRPTPRDAPSGALPPHLAALSSSMRATATVGRARAQRAGRRMRAAAAGERRLGGGEGRGRCTVDPEAQCGV